MPVAARSKAQVPHLLLIRIIRHFYFNKFVLGCQKAKHFILENDQLIDGYRPNLDNPFLKNQMTFDFFKYSLKFINLNVLVKKIKEMNEMTNISSGNTQAMLIAKNISKTKEYESVDAIVYGIPWEGAVTWGDYTGCELGPKVMCLCSGRYLGYLPELPHDVDETMDRITDRTANLKAYAKVGWA